MIIGIISDTHNDIELTKKAIAVFKQEGAELVVHAGDLTSCRMMDLFEGCQCKFVLGNGDIDTDMLKEKCGRLGFGDVDVSSDFVADGKRFLVMHGNDVPFFRRAVESGDYQYIIKGHTHFFENYRTNKTRIINPGSVYDKEEPTIAILDTATDKVKKMRLERA